MATTKTGSGGAAGGQGGKDAGSGTGAGAKSSATGAGGRKGGAGRKSSAAGTSAKKSNGPGSAPKKTGAAKKSTGAGKTGAAKSGGSRGAGKSAGGTRKSSAGAKGTGASTGASAKLRNDLREFVQAHPGGWGHNEWIGLVNLLRDRGHDTSDTDAIGMALERERLTLVLERVPGLGAQRVNAIADKYPRIWNLMQTGAEELAMAANLPKAVAKKVKDALP